MMSCALEHDFYSEAPRLWMKLWKATYAEIHARTPRRKIAVGTSAFVVAAAWFWATMLIAPPQTAAGEMVGLDLIQITKDAPLDSAILVPDTL